MASERSEFIKRQAAALQVASVNRGPAQVGVKVKPAEVRRRNECVVGAAIDAASAPALRCRGGHEREGTVNG